MKNIFDIQNSQDYENFVKYLYEIRKIESSKHREMHIKIINSKLYVISIESAKMRFCAKQILKTDYENYLSLAKFTSYEETMIYGFVIAGIKDEEKQIALLKNFVNKIDTWAVCDSVISTLKNIKKSKNKNKYFNFFSHLCFSQKEFTARFGIVGLMTYFLEENYIDEIYKIITQVNNHAYYVDMAIAWLISFGYMKFPEKTIALFKKKTFNKFIQNKAISKCRDSFQISQKEKDNLLQFRIK